MEWLYTLRAAIQSVLADDLEQARASGASYRQLGGPEIELVQLCRRHVVLAVALVAAQASYRGLRQGAAEAPPEGKDGPASVSAAMVVVPGNGRAVLTQVLPV